MAASQPSMNDIALLKLAVLPSLLHFLVAAVERHRSSQPARRIVERSVIHRDSVQRHAARQPADGPRTSGFGHHAVDWRPAGHRAAGPQRQPVLVGALRSRGAILGVDAGGSGTRAALVVDGVVTDTLTSGPFNYLLQDGGVEQMAALIRESAAVAAGIGVPGIARQPGAAQSFARAVSEASGAHVSVASDAAVAWLGAFLGGPGIAVIAGTGSVAVGGNAGGHGNLIRCGGHGFLVGDQGGGYWIGRRGLQAALAGAEGTGPATGLTEALQEATGATLDELVVRVHQDPRNRSLLAGLARVVAACAGGSENLSGGSRDAADEVALGIIKAAAVELATLAGVLRRRLGELPVAGVGGVFAITELWEEFSSRTDAVAPLAVPELGAALLAGRESEVLDQPQASQSMR